MSVRITTPLARLYYIARVVQSFRGSAKRHCPCCDHRGRFLTYGQPPRYDALCPNCGSLERHRLLALCERAHGIFAGKDVLDFAAKGQTPQHIVDATRSYATADLYDRRADHREDIERLSFADASFDVVLCSHVLEHVDDRKALGELRRILRPDGRLVLMIPIIEGWDRTYENPDVSDARGRLLHFGQANHVRYYGRDVRDRVREAGFEFIEFTADGAGAVEYALSRGEKVFLCAPR